MKKYIKTDGLTPEVIEYLKNQGVNLEGKGGKYLVWTPVEKVNTPGYYREDEDGKLFYASLNEAGIEKNAEITVFAKAAKVEPEAE